MTTYWLRVENSEMFLTPLARSRVLEKAGFPDLQNLDGLSFQDLHKLARASMEIFPRFSFEWLNEDGEAQARVNGYWLVDDEVKLPSRVIVSMVKSRVNRDDLVGSMDIVAPYREYIENVDTESDEFQKVGV